VQLWGKYIIDFAGWQLYSFLAGVLNAEQTEYFGDYGKPHRRSVAEKPLRSFYPPPSWQIALFSLFTPVVSCKT